MRAWLVSRYRPSPACPWPGSKAISATHIPDGSEQRVAAAMVGVEVRPDGAIVDWRLRPDRLRALARSMWEWHGAPLLPAVSVPALWIVADTGDAPWTAAKRAAVGTVGSLAPRSHFEWLVGEHDVHAHRPDDVAALIRGSIDGGFLGD